MLEAGREIERFHKDRRPLDMVDAYQDQSTTVSEHDQQRRKKASHIEKRLMFIRPHPAFPRCGPPLIESTRPESSTRQEALPMNPNLTFPTLQPEYDELWHTIGRAGALTRV